MVDNTKKSTRIELTEQERETLDNLKIFFDKNTRNAVLRHLIKIAKQKYIEN